MSESKLMPELWKPSYSRWRHGGWYVHNTRYPNGGCGCVSNNYIDKRWRVACDSRPLEQQPTFSSRDDAAQAERIFVEKMELLEALKECITEEGAFVHINPDTFRRRLDAINATARAAIAKATGE